MAWLVEFADEFDLEFGDLSEDVQDELLLAARLLEVSGPNPGRPYGDTLKGSEYPNMKELRFRSGKGVWRVAFAFDPERNAILLVAGNKGGAVQARFYKQLIEKTDQRYSAHLKKLVA